MHVNFSNISNEVALANVSSKYSLHASDTGILVAIYACLCACLWIIVLNGLLIYCFWKNRHESWCSHTKNILSMTAIDLLVGLTMLTSLFISSKAYVHIYECIVGLSLCMATQTATSLNVLRFCILRFYVVHVKRTVKEHSANTVLVQTFLIWIVSTTLIALPLFSWSAKQSIVTRCTWDNIFTVNQVAVDVYMFHILLIPALATTVMYVLLALRLKRARNRISPGNGWVKDTEHTHTSKTSTTPSENGIKNQNSNGPFKSKILKPTPINIRGENENTNYHNKKLLGVPSPESSNYNESAQMNSASSELVPCVDLFDTSGDNKIKNTQTLVQEHPCEYETELPKCLNQYKRNFKSEIVHELRNTDVNKRDVYTTNETSFNRTSNKHPCSTFSDPDRYLDTHNPSGSKNLEQKRPQVSVDAEMCKPNTDKNELWNKRLQKLTVENERREISNTITVRGYKRTRKVIITIGMLLLLINVSILPYILVLGIKFTNPTTDIPAFYGFLSLLFLLLNSAINPIIYAIRVKPLRTAFISMCKEMCCCICKKRCRRGT